MFRNCIFLSLLFLLISCGGGGSSSGGSNSAGLDEANFGCDGSCTSQHLSQEDVTIILRQIVTAAEMIDVAVTAAITDRVGNVLAVYQMEGAPTTTTFDGQIGAVGGLEGATVPATLAAISKAGTGAFLSSQGNAFSTRTASQIIQENFNPGELFQAGGPLFGVQISQLICSDVNVLNPDFNGGLRSGSQTLASGLVGPRPLPLGLSADPGGIPLYKQGDVVGGVGIEFDGVYRIDRKTSDVDDDPEERIALMASQGYEFPSEIAGNRLFVLGKSLRTADLSYGELGVFIDVLFDFDPARLVAVPLFSDGSIRAGATFGDASSGVARTSRAGVPAAVLVDGGGRVRFPSRDGTSLPGGAQLRTAEVEALLDSVLVTAFRTRAAIRNPRDSQAHVTIWVVDTEGVPLGMVRTSDAPVFGIDVALQKARTAVFFSSADAGDALNAVRARNSVGDFDDYVGRTRAFLGPTALTGTHAFPDRSGGNLSRPFYPDGINGNDPGPFSLPFPGTAAGRTWSPFNTGLQLDLVFQRVVAPLGIPAPPSAIPDSCTDSGVLGRRLQNGIQIFPGSVPLYRNSTLIGGVGISGDGVDQDDLICFYGSSRTGLDFAGHTGVGDPVLGFNAPPEIRADRIETPVGTTRLRYVNCPESPFRGTNEQRVCEEL